MSSPITYAGHTWPSARDWCLWVMQHNAAPGPAQNGQQAALDAYRAEVLAADGQAYNGELAMLRGLVATLNAVAEHGDLSDVRKLLGEHASDDAAAREEKASGADAAPDFFQPGHTYADTDHGTDWKFRCDSVTTHPDNNERTALGWRFFRGEWEPYAYHEDDWDVHQHLGHTDVTEGGEGR